MTTPPSGPLNIEFRQPPQTAGRPQDGKTWKDYTAEFVNALAWHRGEWAVFRTGLKPSSAYAHAAMLRKQYPNAEWVARRDVDETHTVFVRVLYV